MGAVDYTVEQVLALAPDASSASSARGLASSRKWPLLASQGQAVWGECQGSGSSPYQTRVDLSEPAFKCSCPSRKFPCKHGLALLLLYASDRNSFTEAEAPGWVSEWLASRAARVEKQAERAEIRAAKQADAVEQAKRAERREARVDAGLQELALWLRDAMRRGIAALQSEPFSFWDRMAGRMVDAQAPGVGRILRELPSAFSSPATDQHGHILNRFAQLHLLVRAWQNIDLLPLGTQEDVKSVVGFSTNQDLLLQQAGVRDEWVCWAQYEQSLDDGLRVQRSWLWGESTGQKALVLSFAPRGGVMDPGFVPGMKHEAELVYYPSASPLRALPKSRKGSSAVSESFPAAQTLRQAFEEYGAAVSCNPWLDRFPMAISGARISAPGVQPCLVDAEARSTPLILRPDTALLALAVTGGRAATWFGEYDGGALRLLCVHAENRLVGLTG